MDIHRLRVVDFDRSASEKEGEKNIAKAEEHKQEEWKTSTDGNNDETGNECLDDNRSPSGLSEKCLDQKRSSPQTLNKYRCYNSRPLGTSKKYLYDKVCPPETSKKYSSKETARKSTSKRDSFIRSKSKSENFKSPHKNKFRIRDLIIKASDVGATKLLQGDTYSRRKKRTSNSFLSTRIKQCGLHDREENVKVKKEKNEDFFFVRETPSFIGYCTKRGENKRMRTKNKQDYKLPNDMYGFQKRNRFMDLYRTSCYSFADTDKLKKMRVKLHRKPRAPQPITNCYCKHHAMKVLNLACDCNNATSSIFYNLVTYPKPRRSHRRSHGHHGCDRKGLVCETFYRRVEDKTVAVTPSSLSPVPKKNYDARVGPSQVEISADTRRRPSRVREQFPSSSQKPSPLPCIQNPDEARAAPIPYYIPHVKHKLPRTTKKVFTATNFRKGFISKLVKHITNFYSREKNLSPKICVNYVFFGLLIVLGSPCLLAIILAWAIICPTKFTNILKGTRHTTRVYSMNIFRKKNPRCEYQRMCFENYLPKNKRSFLSSVAGWYSHAVGTVVNSFNAVISLFKLKKKPTTYAGSSFLPSSHPNPRKRYTLYYVLNRGWVIKPLRRRNIRSCAGSRVMQSMRCEFRPTLWRKSKCFNNDQQKIKRKECPMHGPNRYRRHKASPPGDAHPSRGTEKWPNCVCWDTYSQGSSTVVPQKSRQRPRRQVNIPQTFCYSMSGVASSSAKETVNTNLKQNNSYEIADNITYEKIVTDHLLHLKHRTLPFRVIFNDTSMTKHPLTNLKTFIAYKFGLVGKTLNMFTKCSPSLVLKSLRGHFPKYGKKHEAGHAVKKTPGIHRITSFKDITNNMPTKYTHSCKLNELRGHIKKRETAICCSSGRNHKSTKNTSKLIAYRQVNNEGVKTKPYIASKRAYRAQNQIKSKQIYENKARDSQKRKNPSKILTSIKPDTFLNPDKQFRHYYTHKRQTSFTTKKQSNTADITAWSNWDIALNCPCGVTHDLYKHDTRTYKHLPHEVPAATHKRLSSANGTKAIRHDIAWNCLRGETLKKIKHGHKHILRRVPVAAQAQLSTADSMKSIKLNLEKHKISKHCYKHKQRQKPATHNLSNTAEITARKKCDLAWNSLCDVKPEQSEHVHRHKPHQTPLASQIASSRTDVTTLNNRNISLYHLSCVEPGFANTEIECTPRTADMDSICTQKICLSESTYILGKTRIVTEALPPSSADVQELPCDYACECNSVLSPKPQLPQYLSAAQPDIPKTKSLHRSSQPKRSSSRTRKTTLASDSQANSLQFGIASNYRCSVTSPQNKTDQGIKQIGGYRNTYKTSSSGKPPSQQRTLPQVSSHRLQEQSKSYGIASDCTCRITQLTVAEKNLHNKVTGSKFHSTKKTPFFEKSSILFSTSPLPPKSLPHKCRCSIEKLQGSVNKQSYSSKVSSTSSNKNIAQGNKTLSKFLKTPDQSPYSGSLLRKCWCQGKKLQDSVNKQPYSIRESSTSSKRNIAQGDRTLSKFPRSPDHSPHSRSLLRKCWCQGKKLQNSVNKQPYSTKESSTFSKRNIAQGGKTLPKFPRTPDHSPHSRSLLRKCWCRGEKLQDSVNKQPYSSKESLSSSKRNIAQENKSLSKIPKTPDHSPHSKSLLGKCWCLSKKYQDSVNKQPHSTKESSTFSKINISQGGKTLPMFPKAPDHSRHSRSLLRKCWCRGEKLQDSVNKQPYRAIESSTSSKRNIAQGNQVLSKFPKTPNHSPHSRSLLGKCQCQGKKLQDSVNKQPHSTKETSTFSKINISQGDKTLSMFPKAPDYSQHSRSLLRKCWCRGEKLQDSVNKRPYRTIESSTSSKRNIAHGNQVLSKFPTKAPDHSPHPRSLLGKCWCQGKKLQDSVNKQPHSTNESSTSSKINISQGDKTLSKFPKTPDHLRHSRYLLRKCWCRGEKLEDSVNKQSNSSKISSTSSKINISQGDKTLSKFPRTLDHSPNSRSLLGKCWCQGEKLQDSVNKQAMISGKCRCTKHLSKLTLKSNFNPDNHTTTQVPSYEHFDGSHESTSEQTKISENFAPQYCSSINKLEPMPTAKQTVPSRQPTSLEPLNSKRSSLFDRSQSFFERVSTNSKEEKPSTLDVPTAPTIPGKCVSWPKKLYELSKRISQHSRKSAEKINLLRRSSHLLSSQSTQSYKNSRKTEAQEDPTQQPKVSKQSRQSEFSQYRPGPQSLIPKMDSLHRSLQLKQLKGKEEKQVDILHQPQDEGIQILPESGRCKEQRVKTEQFQSPTAWHPTRKTTLWTDRKSEFSQQFPSIHPDIPKIHLLNRSTQYSKTGKVIIPGKCRSAEKQTNKTRPTNNKSQLNTDLQKFSSFRPSLSPNSRRLPTDNRQFETPTALHPIRKATLGTDGQPEFSQHRPTPASKLSQPQQQIDILDSASLHNSQLACTKPCKCRSIYHSDEQKVPISFLKKSAQPQSLGMLHHSMEKHIVSANKKRSRLQRPIQRLDMLRPEYRQIQRNHQIRPNQRSQKSLQRIPTNFDKQPPELLQRLSSGDGRNKTAASGVQQPYPDLNRVLMRYPGHNFQRTQSRQIPGQNCVLPRPIRAAGATPLPKFSRGPCYTNPANKCELKTLKTLRPCDECALRRAYKRRPLRYTPPRKQLKKVVIKKKAAAAKKEKDKKSGVKTFFMCLRDLLNKTEREVWPMDVTCHPVWVNTLKHRPCFCIYKTCPRMYPAFLNYYKSLQYICQMFVYIITICFWGPLVLCGYFCYNFMCLE